MVRQERTRRLAQTSFTVASIDGDKYGKSGTKLSPQDIINLGNAIGLDGWWLAGQECLANFEGNASAYARMASAESKRKNDGVPYSFNTIRQYVSYVVRSLEQGDKRKDYKGIDHLRATWGKASTKSKRAPKEDTGKRVVNASVRKAYSALMATPEYKALPKYERDLIRKLSKGEAFHTNIG